jgi:hypothetical protein
VGVSRTTDGCILSALRLLKLSCWREPLKTPGQLLSRPRNKSPSNPRKLLLREFVEFSVRQRDA